MNGVYKQGAEAKLYIEKFLGKNCLVKQRCKKHYRHPDLDKTLTVQRLKNEVRALIKCRQIGICTPALFYVDCDENKIYMEHVADSMVMKECVDQLIRTGDRSQLYVLAKKIGQMLAILHQNNIVHGDLTTSNVLVKDFHTQDPTLVLIDFGLSIVGADAEEKGVDLYVLERAFLSAHPNTRDVFDLVLKNYESYNTRSDEVIKKLEEIRMRGRKRTMVG